MEINNMFQWVIFNVLPWFLIFGYFILVVAHAFKLNRCPHMNCVSEKRTQVWTGKDGFVGSGGYVREYTVWICKDCDKEMVYSDSM